MAYIVELSDATTFARSCDSEAQPAEGTQSAKQDRAFASHCRRQVSRSVSLPEPQPPEHSPKLSRQGRMHVRSDASASDTAAGVEPAQLRVQVARSVDEADPQPSTQIS